MKESFELVPMAINEVCSLGHPWESIRYGTEYKNSIWNELIQMQLCRCIIRFFHSFFLPERFKGGFFFLNKGSASGLGSHRTQQKKPLMSRTLLFSCEREFKYEACGRDWGSVMNLTGQRKATFTAANEINVFSAKHLNHSFIHS